MSDPQTNFLSARDIATRLNASARKLPEECQSWNLAGRLALGASGVLGAAMVAPVIGVAAGIGTGVATTVGISLGVASFIGMMIPRK